MINPYACESPRDVAQAVEAASDEQIGPALAALSIAMGRAATRDDLIAVLRRVVASQEN